MDEKTMVSDALVGINGELKMFGDMILCFKKTFHKFGMCTGYK